jgi:hypothetical protein
MAERSTRRRQEQPRHATSTSAERFRRVVRADCLASVSRNKTPGAQPVLTHTGHRTDQRLHIDTMKYWPVSGSASLRFDVGGPNDLAPFLSLLGNELAEVLASPRGPCRPGRRVGPSAGPEHGHRGYHQAWSRSFEEKAGTAEIAATTTSIVINYANASP